MLDKEDLQAIAQLMDAKLAPIQEDLSSVKDRMTSMEGLMDRMEGRMDRMEGRMDRMEGRMDRMEGRMDHMEGRMDTLEETVTRTALTQENIVLPAINALVEGQEMTHQMIKQLATKEEVQDVRDQLQVIKTVVASHSRDIEQLKKAQ